MKLHKELAEVPPPRRNGRVSYSGSYGNFCVNEKNQSWVSCRVTFHQYWYRRDRQHVNGGGAVIGGNQSARGLGLGRAGCDHERRRDKQEIRETSNEHWNPFGRL